ncbi:MAG: tetraacyldisaccharide 4'-kinase, partial [Deltaproteobacteria bacterium]|nr:tetraacyldisaccharide 4'-kinase [Deltaproteobacteria bacterium]
MNFSTGLYAERPGWLRRLLSRPYRAVVEKRLNSFRNGRLSSQSLPARVISVGNLTVGGTGKTPAVIFLAKELAARGVRTAVLSR